MAANKLSVRSLTKRYGSFVALAPTDLDVRAGEFITLLGPSGSGKTTLLMAIAGLIEVDGGSIQIDGKDSTRSRPYDRDVGMVFQNYALFPHLDVFENVAYALRVRGEASGSIRDKVHEALALVRLEGHERRYPRELSGGQQQRIAIARSLIFKPSIVLMDEPLGALDRRLREQMQIEIRRIHRDLAVTVLYVTHDQEEALSMSDRICLMNAGRIEQIDTPAGIYFNPATAFAANFLGESNLLAATPVAGEPGTMTIEGGLRVRARAGHAGRVRLMIRPEAIGLAPPAVEHNLIPARVQDVIMLGALTRLDVVCDGGPALVAKMPSRASVASIAPGDAVSLCFAVEDTIVLPE